MFYKNISCSVKTFHGVTFKPNETKEVSEYINNKYMILVDAPVKEAVNVQQKPSDKPKRSNPKPEEPKSQPKELEAKPEPVEIKEVEAVPESKE